MKPLGKITRTWATPSRTLSMQQKLPIGVIQSQKLHSRLAKATSKVNPALSHSRTASFPISTALEVAKLFL